MYAIVKFQGQQIKVTENYKVYVNRLPHKEGENFEINEVLLAESDGEVKVGLPLIDGAKVKAKVLRHLKGDKVLVFKKKRRKGYKKLNGHRQALTQILIEGIEIPGLSKKQTTEKKETKKAEEPKTAELGQNNDPNQNSEN